MVDAGPGSVHRWDDIADVSGHLVLFVPTAPVTHATREVAASPDPAAHWSIPDAGWPFLDTARSHLLLEASAPPGDSRTELPGILLSALITRLHPPHAEARLTHPEFRLFRTSVEAHFRQHHDAGHYARMLGYAPRTLSRAVQQATGRTAKAYIVERITLEAKRLRPLQVPQDLRIAVHEFDQDVIDLQLGPVLGVTDTLDGSSGLVRPSWRARSVGFASRSSGSRRVIASRADT